MLVLAIESATDAAAVALADENGTIVQSTLSRGRRHAETIAPGIEYCCATADLALSQVDAVVVDVGPGLFTGLRVGVGTAKALAYALERPVVALTSLEVLARAVSQSVAISASGATGERNVRIIPVLDARRGEVVSAEFRVPQGDLDGSRRGQVDRIGDEILQTPEDLVAWLGGLGGALDLVLAGDGAVRYEAILRQVPNARFAAGWLASPPVGVLAAMGVELARNGEFEDPLTLAARYVRHADARINWETRAPRQVAGL
jgi:tRNA threonylcarbamoyladenosine biosynthesis protein TsaB